MGGGQPVCGLLTVEQMCKTLPREAPWEAKDAAFVISGKGGAQDARPVGGIGAIYRPMVAEIGDALHLSHPVRQITQDADGVTVDSEGLTVRARQAIVAIPMAIASSIVYEPMLPVDRAFLNQRMPGGAVIKISIVYDEPFWRADGLSGQSAAPGTPATLTIDACTDTGNTGNAKRPSSGWASLTPTERDVVRLVGNGLANNEIAARLFVSRRTVQTHLTHVYTKLGINSRVQLAREGASHS